MKKILKDRFVWGIAATIVVWIVYTIFQDSGKIPWLPSATIDPLSDIAINGILFVSFVTLGAYRLGKVGGFICFLLGLPILIWSNRNNSTSIDIFLEHGIVILTSLISIFVVTKFVDEKKKLEKALTEVKTLSGLIPICASCKKIRDDKGYWSAVESYISKHSDATFTHGICPDCLKKLYPEEWEQLKDENKS